MVFPFVWMLLVSVQTKAESISTPPTFWTWQPRFTNFSTVLNLIPLGHQLFVSVMITVLRVAAQVALCSLAGYALARMRFRGRGAILAATLAVLMVPGQAFLIPTYQIVNSLGLLGTIWGLVLPGFFSAFGTFLMRQFFITLPRDIVEAARLDGCSTPRLFAQILLPLVAPGMQALAIITALWSWSELMWPLVATTRSEDMPAAVGIATLGTEHDPNYPQLMAAAIMVMAPILIVFIVFQKRVLAGISLSGA